MDTEGGLGAVLVGAGYKHVVSTGQGRPPCEVLSLSLQGHSENSPQI